VILSGSEDTLVHAWKLGDVLDEEEDGGSHQEQGRGDVVVGG